MRKGTSKDCYGAAKAQIVASKRCEQRKNKSLKHQKKKMPEERSEKHSLSDIKKKNDSDQEHL